MPRLFQRFFRVDISRSQGGSGLGLAIVKHIIDAHNQNIYVQSTVGIGSEFSFSLKKSKSLIKLIVLGSKNKLKRFSENLTFKNVIQPERDVIVNNNFKYQG